MSEPTTDEFNARTILKRILRDRYPLARSSHIDEGIAAAYGFRTHAALLAHAKAGGRVLVSAFDQDAFLARLSELQQREELRK